MLAGGWRRDNGKQHEKENNRTSIQMNLEYCSQKDNCWSCMNGKATAPFSVLIPFLNALGATTFEVRVVDLGVSQRYSLGSTVSRWDSIQLMSCHC